MNHVGTDLVEELDLGIFIDVTSLGRRAPRRDLYALGLERGMHDANFGLRSVDGREICPRRFGRGGVDLVPEF